MSKQVAVDVVLIPPQHIIDYIIDLSKEFPNGPTHLNMSDCFPHISLLMGVLNEDDIDETKTKLQSIKKFAVDIPVVISHSSNYQIREGLPWCELVINSSPQLIELQAKVINSISYLLSNSNVSVDMFVSPPTVDPQSVTWVKNYSEDSFGEKYRPHITLGNGTTAKLSKPIRSRGYELALCQLGTFCTCRKLLVRF